MDLYALDHRIGDESQLIARPDLRVDELPGGVQARFYPVAGIEGEIEEYDEFTVQDRDFRRNQNGRWLGGRRFDARCRRSGEIMPFERGDRDRLAVIRQLELVLGQVPDRFPVFVRHIDLNELQRDRDFVLEGRLLGSLLRWLLGGSGHEDRQRNRRQDNQEPGKENPSSIRHPNRPSRRFPFPIPNYTPPGGVSSALTLRQGRRYSPVVP